jgi:hypothetical protein
MSFDVDRVPHIQHTEGLVRLATDPGSFTVHGALSAIMDFVRTYTVTSSVNPGTGGRRLDPRLRKIRQKARRIERKLKKCNDTAVRRVLEKHLKDVLEVYKSERDEIENEKKSRIRDQFRQARTAGNHHLAWKLAKLNLAGKGGGVKSSATMAISRSDWEAHFGNVYKTSGAPRLDTIDIGQAVSTTLDSSITGEEITSALEKKKNLRAPGPDGFRVDFLRIVRYDETVTRAIANFFNLIFSSSEVPAEWDNAFLFVLYKGKGDPADANNYRGITLKSQFLKLLESVICNRLTEWFECRDLLPEEQLAYRRGLSGTDHLFLLNVLIEDAMARGKTLYVALVDLRKAFPSVDRGKLLKDLVEAGVSSRTVSLIRRLYSFDTFQVLLDGVPGTVVFSVVVGVHEGSCLSPMLFVFFIRDLPRTLANLSGLVCPEIGLRRLCCMVFADDVNLFSYEVRCTQTLVDTTVAYFLEKGLLPNPDKCEFLAISSRKKDAVFVVQSVARPTQDVARYLGLHYSRDGKWDHQRVVSLSRARAALGRCKIMVSTIGRHNIKAALELFDSVVASVYRFGLGVWGVNVGHVRKLDDLFADFVRWLFRFPSTTGRDTLLANFARRCAKCDSLYLASVQMARASSSKNMFWRDTISDLESSVITSKWFTTVCAELQKRGMREEVLAHGPCFVGERKAKAVEFAQYCFHFHLNVPNGTSADQIRRMRPFGVFPFLLRQNPEKSRFLFAFLCSNWRYIERLRCSRYPSVCDTCDQENSSVHVLFQCPRFCLIRDAFYFSTGKGFHFSEFASDDWSIQNALCDVGKKLYFEIAATCDSLPSTSDISQSGSP